MSTCDTFGPTGSTSIPDSIESLQQLEELLSRPGDGVVESLRRLDGDIMILGAGGKMGPSLTMMAKRASDAAGLERRVIAVDRFRSQEKADRLQKAGVETIRCDLLDREQIERLPDAKNIVFMLGKKFGACGEEPLTWAVNTHAPSLVCSKFRDSRIVAFSSGNIYGLSPIANGGSVESDTPCGVGDYAVSVLGRERIFQYFSQALGIPTVLIRLNYAIEMRYGVLVDVAERVWKGEPIDVTMGCANVIWQGDANAVGLRAFEIASSPASILNLTGPEQLSFRRTAEQFAQLMGKTANLVGNEAGDALISNAQLCQGLFGYPQISVHRMMSWIADWVMKGGDRLAKPTHFETRNGKY